MSVPCKRWWFPFIVHLVWWPATLVIASNAQPAVLQPDHEFHRTLPIRAGEPVTLDVQLAQGDLQIGYARDAQVSITAIAQLSAGGKVGKQFPSNSLAIEQDGNYLKIRRQSSEKPMEGKIIVRIDVPYRSEVNSLVGDGKQTIIGIMGPVTVRSRKGDIKVSYVSKGVIAEAVSGNVNLEVIGERVEARTGNGNISCIRAVQGASAETENGDIVLMVVGPSRAYVKKGAGRIDVGGARGSLMCSTIQGDLHVKATLHDDWKLNSESGNLHVELPPVARFEIEVFTNTGDVSIDRDDMERSPVEVCHLHQKVNGGGKRIEMQTNIGKIVIR